MAEAGLRPLRVLIANERGNRLDLLSRTVAALGHELVASEGGLASAGALVARTKPDAALVGLSAGYDEALTLIDAIARADSSPVIALLSVRDPARVHEAAARGVFAYVVDPTPEELESALVISRERFVEYQNLKAAFGRRAVIEQAKGILMAHHGIGGDGAFELLRSRSQQRGRKLAEIAAAIVDSYLLLQPPATQPPP